MANKYFNDIDLQGVFKVKGSVAPIDGQDLVNLDYLQNYVSGVRDPKDACKVATIGSNISLSGGAPDTLDGISLALNDRILVKDQSNGAQNGLYRVSVLGTGSNGTWVRTADADVDIEVTQGLFVYVAEGSINAKSGWLLTTSDPITVGTTSLSFVQVTGLGDVTAGSGLSKSGNTLDVNVDNTTLDINSDQLRIHPSYAGQTSIITLGTITTGTWNASTIGVAYGGTGATTASGARTSLGAAASGANSDITSLSGLTTPLSIAQGGTGGNTATQARNNIGAVGKYATTITSGQATYNVTHNLGTEDIGKVHIYDTTNKEEVFGVLTKIINTNTVQLQFGTNTSTDYRVVITA